MKMLSCIIFSITVFSSCYSYKIFPKEYRKFEYTGEKKSAFILNPESKKEYAILAHSGIFNLTNDSSSQGRFLDMFNIPKKFKKKTGKALLNNYYKTNGDAAGLELF